LNKPFLEKYFESRDSQITGSSMWIAGVANSKTKTMSQSIHPVNAQQEGGYNGTHPIII